MDFLFGLLRDRSDMTLAEIATALKVEQLYNAVPFRKRTTKTVIADLSVDDMIPTHVIDGPMNRAAFDLYIETQLAPLLEPGCTVILDNLSVHRSPRAAGSSRTSDAGLIS